jgi:hypothetical protein
LTHAFTCEFQDPMESMSKALKDLQQNLSGINTLVEDIDTFTDGMVMQENFQCNPHTTVHALTVGSLHGPDVLLTAAFTDQFHSIEWHHLLMGRLSHSWVAAVAMYLKTPHNTSFQTRWMTQAITVLWRSAQSEWAYRNTVVCGSND